MKSYSKSFWVRLYNTMLGIRLCEESLVEPITKGIIGCPAHLYSGQEAIAAGVCTALTRQDRVFGNHRSHGHFLAKGGQIEALISEVYGKPGGCSGGRGGSMHVIDTSIGFYGSVPIVAGTISLATGTALASKIRRDGRVTVSFFGDGATNEGVFYESLNFAALHRLPIIYACENNLYSTHMPVRECRAETHIARTVLPFGLKGARIDGNNVLKVYEAARQAIAECRRGQGPFFFEFMTYRLRGHVGPDDNVQGAHSDIRPESEIKHWRRKDPISLLAQFLLRKEICSAADLTAIETRLRKQIQRAHFLAQRAQYSPVKSLTTNVSAADIAARKRKKS